MSSRKRTKRKNSDEDFDVDDGDDGIDNDDINKWSCQSCTYMNRAAAYRCSVCGTRKGTSTRRSRCNDNVVEMQKTITDMVQKQVEKEKLLKRKERSLIKSMTRETSIVKTSEEIKIEEPDISVEKPKTPVPRKVESPEACDEKITQDMKVSISEQKKKIKLKSKSPAAIETPKAEVRAKSPSGEKRKEKLSIETKELKNVEKTLPANRKRTEAEKIMNIHQEKTTNDDVTPTVSITANNHPITAKPFIVNPGVMTVPRAPVSLNVPSTSKTILQPPASAKQSEKSILQHLPERVVRKLNQPLSLDYDLLKAHKRITGIDPIVAESEAVLLPHDWDRHKVMKGLTSSLGSIHTVSPTTSRQSSETDSLSSEGNRSFDTPHNETSLFDLRSCQIPDYMIHRDAPQKIFIVANGFPAYFEEFPKRMQE